MSTNPNPAITDAILPNRKVRNGQDVRQSEMDRSDFLTQAMWAPGLDVQLSSRHQGRWCGITVFPAATIVQILPFQYFQPRHNRGGITQFTSVHQRSERHWRQPGVIARSLDLQFSDADISGVSYVQWLHELTDIEDNPQTSPSFAMYGVTLFQCFQSLTLPIVPNAPGALFARLRHLQSLRGLSLADVSEKCQQLVRASLPQEYWKSLLAEIEGAHNAIVGSEYEGTLFNLIGTMITGCETTLERLTSHSSMMLAEMDKASRDKPGKASADGGDRKVFFLLGQAVPQLSRNVYQDGGQRTQTREVGETQPAGMFKECAACSENIKINARKCRYCGEPQPMPSEPLALVPEKPKPIDVPIDEAVDDTWLADALETEGEQLDDDGIDAASALAEIPTKTRKVRNRED